MPGGRLDQDAREEAALLLSCGVDPKEVARRFRCHESTVSRYGRNNLLFGSPLPPLVCALGRPRKITEEARQGLVDWLLENGDDSKLSYLEEMVLFLQEEFGIFVSKSTISRMLSVLKITYKTVSS